MLFGNNKDKEDSKQTQAVKQATTAPTFDEQQKAPTTPNPFENQPQTNQDNSFVNPFAKDQPQDQSLSQPTEVPMAPNMNEPSAPNPFENQPQTTAPMQDPFAQAANQTMGADMSQIQEMIDETVEKVIEEAWGQLTNRVDKVVNWKDKVEQQILLIKEDIVSMRDGFETIEKKLFNKLNSYDKNILDVNSEMKALEKVFQKITPTLVNNVNELSKIANDLRPEKRSKKSN